MVPATVAADEKILEILGKGFEKHFVFGTPQQKEAAEEQFFFYILINFIFILLAFNMEKVDWGR